MAVTLVDCQHSGSDPRRISPLKIMLSLGAIISETIFKNRGNTSKGSTPFLYKIKKQTQKDRSLEGKRIAQKKVEAYMARSLPVENLLKQNVGSIINYLQ